jgi:twitching motility protein PilT
MARIDTLLLKVVEIGASDVHVSVGSPPIVRRFGQLTRLDIPPLTADFTRAILAELLNAEQKATFDKDLEVDFAYELAGRARFRCNAFVQRKGVDICFRIILPKIPSFEELGLPAVLRKVCDNHQGLILVTGAAGTGKTTTLASVVDFINTNRAHHVLTVEDPIEYVHPLKKGVVNQRQLGAHTKSAASALKAALREDPDVIVVGDLRDLETITLAISASETGHLVVGSMNTSSAHKTIDKIIDSYPGSQQNQIRTMLGESLKAVLTQRLLPRLDGKGMALACEVLLGSRQLANLIKDSKTFQIPNLMATGRSFGMKTMEEAIADLVKQGVVPADSGAKGGPKPAPKPAAAAPAPPPKPAAAAPAAAKAGV